MTCPLSVVEWLSPFWRSFVEDSLYMRSYCKPNLTLYYTFLSLTQQQKKKQAIKKKKLQLIAMLIRFTQFDIIT